jgi:hypothetical protein
MYDPENVAGYFQAGPGMHPEVRDCLEFLHLFWQENKEHFYEGLSVKRCVSSGD